MHTDLVTPILAVVGILLIIAEVLLPGLVVIFIGIAALLMALMRWMGLVTSLPLTLILWMITSGALVLGLRGLVRRWFPAEVTHGNASEELQGFGADVEVLEDCHEPGAGMAMGRIRYQGTTWPAHSTEGTILKGRRARLVYRDNIAWVIEPMPGAEAEPVATAALLQQSTPDRTTS